jgi:ferric-dicitrate binding protein FerR (iron transport regulator)/TolA-binding protein
LDAGGREAFESHASACTACSSAVQRWREVSDAIGEGVRNRARPISSEESRILIDRARTVAIASAQPDPRRRVALRWLVVPAAAAVALAVVLGIVWFADSGLGDRSEERGEAESGESRRAVTAEADRSTTSKIGPSHVVVAPGSEIEVATETAAETRLELVRGGVALDVGSLDPGESLTVSAGDLEARVVGTVFAVSMDVDRVTVAVVEGKVDVSRTGGLSRSVGGGQRLITAVDQRIRVESLPSGERDRIMELFVEGFGYQPVGQERTGAFDEHAPRVVDSDENAVAEQRGELRVDGISDGETVDGPPEVGADDPIDTLRDLVAAGRFIEAEGELTEHLQSQPGDTVAWSLLADCRRKSGRWSDAVSAYLEVIDRAGKSEADRARYKAGVILQERLGDHLAAARLFGEYLDGSGAGALAPDAVLRRARSLIAIGRGEEARALLERLVAEHPDVPAADAARRVLGGLEQGGEG